MPKLNLQDTPQAQTAALEEAASAPGIEYLNDEDVSIDFDDSGQLQLTDRRKNKDEVKVPEETDPVEETPAPAGANPYEERFSAIENTLNRTLEALEKLATGKSSPSNGSAPEQTEDGPSVEGLDLNDPKIFMKYLTDTIDHRISKVIRPYEAGFQEMDVKRQLQDVYQKFGADVIKKENTDRMSVLIVNNPGMTVEQAWKTVQAMDKIKPAAAPSSPTPRSKDEVVKKQRTLSLESNDSVGSGTPVAKQNGRKLTLEQAAEAAIAEVLGRS